MKDYLVKALAYNDNVRIYCVTCPNTLNEIGDRFSYYPSALDAVGRVLSIGAMMGSMLKKEETVTIRVDGNGQIGKIIVDADAHGHVRGYCDNPHCHFEYNDGRLNAKATIGDRGLISVIKDLKLKEPFIGTTPIISGEMGEDFAYYFNVSEQLPSAVSVGVLVNTDSQAVSAGGLIIQLLPNTPDEVITELEEKLKVLPPISEMLESGLTPEAIVKNVSLDARIIEMVPIEFKCTCSKERFRRGILSLGADEINQMIEEDGKADTVCHFCGNEYHFSKEELEEIASDAKEIMKRKEMKKNEA